jgi:hypothetical protein
MAGDHDMAEPKVMALRRPDVCSRCGVAIAAGSQAEWDPNARLVTCMSCVESRTGHDAQSATEAEHDRGSAGASARRRYDRLQSRRGDDVKKKLGRRLGGVYLALSEEPQSTHAWGVGSKGEQALGTYLETLHDESRVIVLHDRRIPGTRANIDHIAICRNGIYAIDAKNYEGKVQRIDKGGWFSSDQRLYVGRRDCSKLVSGMAKQVEAIRTALGDSAIQEFAVEVNAALCFVDAEWSLFAKPFALNGVWIGWARALGERLLEDGPISPDRLALLAQRITRRLPVA